MSAQPFLEKAAASGLVHDYSDSYLISGGIALFDFDLDGDLDVYACGGRVSDRLFANDGNGLFTDVSEQYGIKALTEAVTTISVTTGDIDNDGVREIYLGTLANSARINFRARNMLLQLDPLTGEYEDRAREAGLRDSLFAAGAQFMDYNRDGLLDLYVLDYLEMPVPVRDSEDNLVGFNHDCGGNRMYLGIGDGNFRDVTNTTNLNDEGCSLAVVASDTDNDGDQDLLLANDFGRWVEPNALYLNNFPDEPFSNDERTSDMSAEMYGMGIATGDVNGDLLMDYYVTNIGANALFINQGGNQFLRQEGRYRVKDEFTAFGDFTTGWGTFFADLNNDTYLDLYVANGFVSSGVDVDDRVQPDRVYLGTDDERFYDANNETGIRDTTVSRGAVYGDLNGDGLLDMVVLDVKAVEDGTSLLYYENNGTSSNYINFRLTASQSNRDGYGTRVIAYSGGRAFLRELTAGGSHGSQHGDELHVGLGGNTMVDSVLFNWPDGSKGWLYQPDINRTHTISPEDLVVTAVDSYGQRSRLEIFPNPAFDKLYVRGLGESTLFRVFTLSGQEILKGESEFDGSISLLGLPAGVYVLQVDTGVTRFVHD